MDCKYLKIQMEISVATGKLDSFKRDIHLTISAEEKNWALEAWQHAETVMNCTLSMLGEGLGRVSACSKNPLRSEVFISTQNEKLEGGLYHELIEKYHRHFGWTPELIAHIKVASKDFQQRLSETLYYLTREYYIGDVGEGGEECGFFPRH